MAKLPEKCPVCGSTDTVESGLGYGSKMECVECEAFWYFRDNKGTVETVSGKQRRLANEEMIRQAMSRELSDW